MIRLVFAVILTIGALIGLSLRLERDGALPAPAERLRAEVRTLDLGGAVSSALDRAGARDLVEAVAPPSPPPVDAAPTPAPPAPELPAQRDVVAEQSIPEEPEDVAEVVEEEIVPRRAAPFVEAPLPEEENSGSGGNQRMDPDDGLAPTMVASALDQDAWANLIRRMLDVYRRTDERR